MKKLTFLLSFSAFADTSLPVSSCVKAGLISHCRTTAKPEFFNQKAADMCKKLQKDDAFFKCYDVLKLKVKN